MGTMVFQVIYGVAMGFAVFALIGVILMTFCDKYKCRYLMYFACIILFLFAIIGFLLSFIFSLILPVMYWGCDWLSVSINTGAGFTTNLGSILDSATASKITPCLADGNGDMVSAVANGIGTAMNKLK
jgi:energy-coupling factor transporter transmembrane protein EcfT